MDLSFSSTSSGPRSRLLHCSRISLYHTVLQLLNSERNTFGLRSNDFERYQKHLTARIHRLRQVTGSTHGNAKGYKKPVAPGSGEGGVTDVR